MAAPHKNPSGNWLNFTACISFQVSFYFYQFQIPVCPGYEFDNSDRGYRNRKSRANPVTAPATVPITVIPKSPLNPIDQPIVLTKTHQPAAPLPLVDGVPPDLVEAGDGFGLLPGESMTVTFRVTAGASSNVTCREGATCELTCTGPCNLDCRGASSCRLTCPGEPTRDVEGEDQCT